MGEQVVVNGAFKIDSDLQIQAKPSMMSVEGGEPAKKHEVGDVPPAFKISIDAVADGYFKIQHALSSDSLENAKKGGGFLLEKLAAVDMSLLRGKTHMEWMKQGQKIKGATEKLVQAGDIEAARVQLEVLTEAVTMVIKNFGTAKETVYRYHCPMAFDNKGAYWLQNHKDTRNPYFGASMLLCKDSVGPLFPEKK